MAIEQHPLLSTLCLCDYLLKIFTVLVSISSFVCQDWRQKFEKGFWWSKGHPIELQQLTIFGSPKCNTHSYYIYSELHHSTLKMLVDLTSQEDPIMFLFQHVTNLQALVFLCFLLPRSSGLVPAELFDFSKI